MVKYRVQREVEQYVARTPRSRRLHEEAVKYLPGGTSRAAHYFDPHPVYAERGEGHYVYDVDGNEYLDFGNNATSLILGHAHPDVVEAMQKAVAGGYSFSNPVESQTRLARLLCERIPSMDAVRFTNSGTEATLNAIRAARAFTGRHKIAKFEGTYQGAHEYATVSHHDLLPVFVPLAMLVRQAQGECQQGAWFPEQAACSPGSCEGLMRL